MKTNDVKFTLENIKSGAFAEAHGKTRNVEFKIYNSLRLLIEAGYKFDDAKAENTIRTMQYKWTYWMHTTDRRFAIVSLHTKKCPKDWLYIIINTKGQIVEDKSYTTLEDAKENMKGLIK